jgi:hypothetical protein
MPSARSDLTDHSLLLVTTIVLPWGCAGLTGALVKLLAVMKAAPVPGSCHIKLPGRIAGKSKKQSLLAIE